MDILPKDVRRHAEASDILHKVLWILNEKKEEKEEGPDMRKRRSQRKNRYGGRTDTEEEDGGNEEAIPNLKIAETKIENIIAGKKKPQQSHHRFET
ncbi:hypothetical protein RIF29_03365 [Crotalaria pallida]|uniref:Uncharacterized protein n=1 Tax=Crotalaria pallida TaxID=3830 RepID=A0AAN9J0R0_CROPI